MVFVWFFFIARGFKQLSLVVRVYCALNETLCPVSKQAAERHCQRQEDTAQQLAPPAERSVGARGEKCAFHPLFCFAWKWPILTTAASHRAGTFERGDIWEAARLVLGKLCCCLRLQHILTIENFPLQCQSIHRTPSPRQLRRELTGLSTASGRV